MKACVLHGIDDIRYEEVEKPIPGPDEILVNVKACGICGSDIPRVFTKGTYHFPTIPGHEFSGEIVELGEGVNNLKIGERGAVIPLIPCHDCPSCEIGNFAQCNNYNYLGSRTDGGFAEYVVVPAENFLHIPDEVSFQEAAMVEPTAVAVHALRRAGLDVGDMVTILGTGPIGLLIGQWAKIWGAGKVLFTDVVQRKLDFARKLGFTHVFNSTQGDVLAWVEKETGGRGSDLVIEAAGVPQTFIQMILMARKGGKVTIMGNPGKKVELEPEVISQILRKELTINGSWNSRFSELPKNEWKLTIDMIAANRLKLKPLITHKVNFSEVNSILTMIRDNEEFYNKVMFVNG